MSGYPTYQRGPSTMMLVLAWVIAVITGLYMLPWAVALTRGRPDSTMIGLINLLAGWTLIGWLVALVLACRKR